ncbi:MAG: hypothetical protein A2Z16_04880 [Chloroflexi bacterium RBG_16_54_18]|nr:MAG: hypothetical protein A2Z16_04880 [Chloroflexi bacterium RBG_16_54_18]
MARIGINPARGMVSDYHPARISLTVISYIPELTGYFADRLKILSLSVASLIQHTTYPYDLVVFDNGSCPEVVDFWRHLQLDGNVDYLILSDKNIGKIGALRILFQAAPGEIIAYSDDDILFYPGWLAENLKILEAFPKVGMVSGVAVRNAALHAHHSLDQLVQHPLPGLTVSFERCIPDEWERDWAASTGRDPQSYLQDSKDRQDTVLKISHHPGSPPSEEETVSEAIGSANHFQFIARKEIILQALPADWSGKLMGHMLELDQAVDDLGYLRLSTCKRTTRHLGNTVSSDMMAEAQKLGLNLDGVGNPESGLLLSRNLPRKPGNHRKRWLNRIPGSRRILMWTYKRLFEILYQ